jgi:hypothetical protein
VAQTENIYGYVNNFGKKPGVWSNSTWLKVRDASGKEWVEFANR